MSLPNGTYLVFGPMHAPTVHVVTKSEQESYWQRLAMLPGLRDQEAALRTAMSVAFNAPNAVYALPAWSVECMTEIAQAYDGPHKAAVRGIAAAIALGRPFAQDEKRNTDNGDEGGHKVPRKPRGPKPTSPSKISAFASLTDGA